jgi:hypothetical protein
MLTSIANKPEQHIGVFMNAAREIQTRLYRTARKLLTAFGRGFG